VTVTEVRGALGTLVGPIVAPPFAHASTTDEVEVRPLRPDG
jgi:hypothetical protein